MTRRLIFSLLTIVIILSMSLGLVGCTEYGNIPFELKNGADDSVARLPGDKTAEAFKDNPNRGFSIDLFMTLDKTSKNYTTTYAFPINCDHPGHSVNGEPIKTYELIKNETTKFKDMNIHNVVLTIFLTNFIDEELDNQSLEQIYSLLRELRSKNYKVILKFAYQHGNKEVKPSTKSITAHMKRLGEWFNSGYASTVVKNTVSAFRLSFVGKDGTFTDNSYSKDELETITDNFANMIPARDNYYTQAPNVSQKNSSKQYSKLIKMGFYNDNMDGKENKYLSGGTNRTKKDYKQYVYQSRVNFNSFGLIKAPENIDGKAILKMVKDGSFSMMNLSYMYANNEVTSPILEAWSTTNITKSELQELNLPYYDEWFLNSDGLAHNRTVMDYLRDFLGYNLSITNLKFEKGERMINGSKKLCTNITFTLTNYGMAAPLFIDRFEVYIKNNATNAYINKGNGLTYPSTYDPTLLVSGGQINFEQLVIGDIDKAEGLNIDHSLGHSIGIKLYERHTPNNLYVRLNNDVPYSNDINWVYSTTRK